jgi:hypothetical protein
VVEFSNKLILLDFPARGTIVDFVRGVVLILVDSENDRSISAALPLYSLIREELRFASPAVVEVKLGVSGLADGAVAVATEYGGGFSE